MRADDDGQDSGSGRSAAGIRRHVTILFSDLCASTFLGHISDPEILAEVMDDVKSAAERVVRHHGGVVNQVHGDGVVAVFGLPTPHEDDVRRAIQAGLDLHAAAREVVVDSSLAGSFSVRMHSGVHSGLVMAGVGDLVLGRYELVGDAVNTAAGLCSQAGPDELVVSESSLRGARAFFQSEDLGDLSLKGKPDPIHAHRVRDRTDVANRFEARRMQGLTPFIGRDFELRRLEEFARQARRGKPRVVTLVGDPGVGKTRSANELIRRVEGEFRVQRGYCESYGGVAPLQPFLGMVRQQFDLAGIGSGEEAASLVEAGLRELGLEKHLSEFLSLLAPGEVATPVAGGDDAVATALSDLFLTLARRHPMLVFIDDWQWIDDASRKVVDILTRSLTDEPMLVLISSRVIDPVAPVVAGETEILEVAPFNRDECTRAIETLVPRPIDLGIAARIHQRSGGNPLFVEELCQSLSEWVDDAPGSGTSEVPVTLHGLIEARAERLPDELAELVGAAAVIGNVIPTWLLEQIGGRRIGHSVLEALANADLIHEAEHPGSLRFKHGITRDVVYNSVRLRQRQALHRRVAEALEERVESDGGEVPFESLAYHYAGAADPERTAFYAERAGDKALGSATLDRARQQYHVAMRAVDQLSQTAENRRRWISICMRWAVACVYSPSRERLEILNRAAGYARELEDLDALAHAHHWLGFMNYSLGEQLDSIAHFDDGLPIAHELGNSRLIAQLHGTLGQSQAAACNYEEALRRLDEALDRKQRQSRSTDGAPPIGSAYALACRSFVLADQGRFDEANEGFSDAIRALRGGNFAMEGSVLALQAVGLIWQGRWDEVMQVAGLAQEKAARVNGPYVFGIARSEVAYARWMLERDARQIEVIRESTEWLVEKGMCLYISLNYGWLADAMTSAGQDDLGKLYGKHALVLAQDKLDRVGEGMACRGLARLAARGVSGLEEPEYYLERAMQGGRSRDSRREEAMTRLRLADLYAGRGQSEVAIELATRARNAFTDMHMDWHEAEARRLLATASRA